MKNFNACPVWLWKYLGSLGAFIFASYLLIKSEVVYSPLCYLGLKFKFSIDYLIDISLFKILNFKISKKTTKPLDNKYEYHCVSKQKRNKQTT